VIPLKNVNPHPSSINEFVGRPHPSSAGGTHTSSGAPARPSVICAASCPGDAFGQTILRLAVPGGAVAGVTLWARPAGWRFSGDDVPLATIVRRPTDGPALVLGTTSKADRQRRPSPIQAVAQAVQKDEGGNLASVTAPSPGVATDGPIVQLGICIPLTEADPPWLTHREPCGRSSCWTRIVLGRRWAWRSCCAYCRLHCRQQRSFVGSMACPVDLPHGWWPRSSRWPRPPSGSRFRRRLLPGVAAWGIALLALASATPERLELPLLSVAGAAWPWVGISLTRVHAAGATLRRRGVSPPRISAARRCVALVARCRLRACRSWRVFASPAFGGPKGTR